MVTVEKAGPDDRYGDIAVDTAKSLEVYREWLAMARPGPGPDGTRRPFWLFRPYRTANDAYFYPSSSDGLSGPGPADRQTPAGAGAGGGG